MENLIFKEMTNAFDEIVLQILTGTKVLASVNVKSLTMGDTKWQIETAVWFNGEPYPVDVFELEGDLLGGGFKKYLKGYISALIKYTQSEEDHILNSDWETDHRRIADGIYDNRLDWKYNKEVLEFTKVDKGTFKVSEK